MISWVERFAYFSPGCPQREMNWILYMRGNIYFVCLPSACLMAQEKSFYSESKQFCTADRLLGLSERTSVENETNYNIDGTSLTV